MGERDREEGGERERKREEIEREREEREMESEREGKRERIFSSFTITQVSSKYRNLLHTY